MLANNWLSFKQLCPVYYIVIKAFELGWCSLQYPLIQADSEDPGQTMQMCRLIWVFTVCICLEDTFLTDMAHIIQ